MSEHSESAPTPARETADLSPVFQVLYENSELVVINKPAGIPMDLDGSQTAPTDTNGASPVVRSVEDWAYAYMKAHGIFDANHAILEREQKRRKQLKFVHQLDAATSGVLCLAFTKGMASRLAHCFEAGTAEKQYVALVAGHMPDTASLESFVATLPVLMRMESTPATLDDVAQPSTSTSASTRAPMHAKSGHDLSASATITHVAASPSAETVAIRLCLPVGYDPLDAHHFRMAVGPLASSPRDAALTPAAEDTQEVVWRRRDRFRPAETWVEVMSRGFVWHEPSQRWWPVTMVRLLPKTGRRHQLRVHCHALGHPIVGDALYAAQPLFRATVEAEQTTMDEAKRATTSGGLTEAFPVHRWPRMYLHAQRLRLPCGVEPAQSEMERVALKKRRRRETLGLETAVVADEADEVTEFATDMPFRISPHDGGASASVG